MASERFDFIVRLRDRFSKPFRTLSTAVKNVLGTIVKLGAAAVAAGAAIAGIAATRFFSGAIAAASSFEEQLARVGAVSQATAEDLGRIEKETLRLGETTRFTATEAAQGAEELARAGQSISEVIDTLGPSLNVAQANSIELADAAQLVATSLNQFGAEADQATRFADALTAGTQNSAQNITQLGNALEFAGPEAKRAGLSIEETVAIIGKLADVGFRGEKGGTALRNALIDLQDPASEATREIRKLGITSDNFLEILDQLAQRGEASEAALLALGKRAGPAISTLVNSGTADLSRLIQTLNGAGGAAERTARQMDQTLVGATKALGSAWESLRINLVKPLLEPIARSIGAVTARIRELAGSEAFDRLRQRLLEIFNNLADRFTRFISEVDFDAVLDKIRDFVTRSGELFNTLADNTGKAVTAVKGAIDVLLLLFNGVKASVEAVVGAISKIFEVAFSGLEGFLKLLRSLNLGELQKEIDIVNNLARLTGDIATGSFERAGRSADNFGAAYNRLAGALKESLPTWDSVSTAVGSTFKRSIDTAGDAVRAFPSVLSRGIAKVKEYAEAAVEAAKGIGLFADEQERAASGPELAARYDELIAKIAQLQREGRGASEESRALQRELQALDRQMGRNAESAGALADAFTALGTQSAAQLENLKRQAVDSFNTIVAAARRGEATQQDVNNAFARLADIFRQSAQGADEFARAQVDAQLRVIAAAAGVTEVLGQTGDSGEDAGNRTADALNRAADAAERLRGEVGGAGEEVQQVEQVTETAVAGISAEIGSAIASFHALGENVTVEVNRLLERIAVRGQAVGDFLQKLAVGLREIQAELEENQRRADEAIARAQSGVDRFGSGIRAIISDFVVLDDITLENLRAELERTNATRQTFFDGLTDSIRQAKRELAELRGEAVEDEADRTQARLEELQQLLRNAIGDPQQAALIREEIALQRQIADERQRVADSEKRIREDRTENVRLAEIEQTRPRRAVIELVVKNELDPLADRISLTDADVALLGERLLAQVRQSGLASN